MISKLYLIVKKDRFCRLKKTPCCSDIQEMGNFKDGGDPAQRCALTKESFMFAVLISAWLKCSTAAKVRETNLCIKRDLGNLPLHPL